MRSDSSKKQKLMDTAHCGADAGRSRHSTKNSSIRIEFFIEARVPEAVMNDNGYELFGTSNMPDCACMWPPDFASEAWLPSR